MKNVQQTKTTDVTALVDELAGLHEQLQAAAPMQKRYDELKKQLACIADTQGDDEVRLSGQTGFVSFGRPTTNRIIKDNARLLDIIGVDEFVAISKPSVTRAAKLLNSSEEAEVFEKQRGTRRVKDIGKISAVLFNNVFKHFEIDEAQH